MLHYISRKKVIVIFWSMYGFLILAGYFILKQLRIQGLENVENKMLIGIILLGAGVFSVLCIRKEWDWYMNNYITKSWIQWFGKGGLKLYTYFIAYVCCVFGLYCVLHAV
ncbi:MAG: hypothetical protein KDD46_07380 [Bdellovibrionales bacterium]|nr:hypothetical protein [Bdellovibrionales bacterium]